MKDIVWVPVEVHRVDGKVHGHTNPSIELLRKCDELLPEIMVRLSEAEVEQRNALFELDQLLSYGLTNE